jgi:hypothetical protein
MSLDRKQRRYTLIYYTAVISNCAVDERNELLRRAIRENNVCLDIFW